MTEPVWRSVGPSDEVLAYAAAHGNPGPDAIRAELAAATAEAYGSLAGMNIGEDQGRLLQLLVEISGARLVVEVGTFTGMSALWLARGLPDGGRLLCFDISAEYPDFGRPYWEKAGVADRIEVRVGPAAERLGELADEPPVDLAFIDADKPNYATYFDALLPRLAPRGLIVVDNVLWSGRIIDAESTDDNTVALRAFNDMVAARDDVDAVMLPVGDGITLIRHRDRG
jgi:caffeoyl-CoA O-methyltransferase